MMIILKSFRFMELVFWGLLIVLTTKFILIWSIKKISILFNLSIESIGEVEGYVTSAPELISVISASQLGMINTITYNVISSNIINIILFIISLLIFNRFNDLYKRKYYTYYMIILISIVIPLFILRNDIDSSIILVPIFIFLYIFFFKYSRKQNSINNEPKEKTFYNKYSLLQFLEYISILAFSIFILYFLGQKLGDCLNTLFFEYKISQFILGAIIGFITSLPELTTFISSQLEYAKYTNNSKKKLATLESLNNLVSSNISNLLIVQTVGIFLYNIYI